MTLTPSDLAVLSNAELAALVREAQNRFDAGCPATEIIQALGLISRIRAILKRRGLDDVSIEFLFSGKNHA